MKKILFLSFALAAFCPASLSLAQEPYSPDLDNLARHQLPDWIQDAKIMIHYVGDNLNLDDKTHGIWNVTEQRRRKICIANNLPVATEPGDLQRVMDLYKKTGARVLVSVLHGAYPGTEGLIMTENEIDAARKNGFHVGIHYNHLRREGEIQPHSRPLYQLEEKNGTTYAWGEGNDPLFDDFWKDALKAEIKRTQADFLFFDGARVPMRYLKTNELVAWYYNWAARSGRRVWVNDDWGLETQENSEHPLGDITDMETRVYRGMPPRPYINWDILANEWNCWINEFGIHKYNGVRWEWRYATVQDKIQMLVYLVSQGGIWKVQMENTRQAWDIMLGVGRWLEANGEAIYNTRPLLPPGDWERTPPRPGKGSVIKPDGRTAYFTELLLDLETEIARAAGPIYFTQRASENLIYAIYCNPAPIPSLLEIKLPSCVRVAKIELLGCEGGLAFTQEAGTLVISVPKSIPSQPAYSFRLSIK